MKHSFTFARISIFFVLFTLGNFCFAQTLWQNANYGMTLEQIKNIYPKAIPVTKDNSGPDGSKELLKINDVKISDESFSVSFFFKDNKLTRVYLNLNTSYNKAAGDRVFNALNRSLTAKYGQPINTKDDKGTTFSTKSISWLSDGVDIFLSAIFIGDKTSTLYILYHIETANNVGNL